MNRVYTEFKNYNQLGTASGLILLGILEKNYLKLLEGTVSYLYTSSDPIDC